MADEGASAGVEEVRCAECNAMLYEGQDRVTTEDRVFCQPCFDRLNSQLESAIRAQGEDVNYPLALVGGVLGGVLGVLAWWGFTVITGIAFGLVAVVIGLAVGKGVSLFAGNKRSRGLQIMAVVVSAVSFVYATYLVNRTFFHEASSENGEAMVLPLLPGLDLFIAVVSAGFGLFDIVFLGIVLYEAWKLPAPVRLAEPEA